ncbi:MAG: hypothetical protein A3F63_00315 [Pseudomonadales bacterium RIFCSPHIGHO2_12_FULL_40_16]|jgi:hypothetical protein|uniref:Uncharacterized protein n=1 Tax=Acinetobacter johnsonii TaxID=40214 RepID=A0A3S9AJH8_ACIJO|nr:hypothetical protein [Acinetobacter johnsonii]AZN63764.1 hypothetical protein CFH90_06875 [Acinetobacter johnsonii]MCF7642262.1 hypothetical protein [Acinetobacter johnsonii]OFW77012.1 MAG: hypothetical protein A2W44_01685 [Acinetobacter sp. RIFCSPHIGHO2_12_41_5]OHC20696.1 MAG: hypothetical protein A3F63_00315 [Pseudomonadales bacterium RIFCSPHIGHO2_12_FULL_40_16]
MDIQKIKELALANGFLLKEQASGNMDLHSYVYEFANAIEQAAKAQAVPEGFVLVDKHQLAQLMANMDSFGKKALGDDYVSFADIAAVLDEAQEPTND